MMRRVMSARSLIKPETQQQPLNLFAPLNVVGVYQDARALARIHELHDSLSANLAWEFDFDRGEWFGFGELGDPHLARKATTAASAADVIVFSAEANTELPSGVRVWVESWIVSKKAHEAALVALLDHRSCSVQWKTTVQAYLRQMAQEAEMDFFTLSPDSPPSPR
jgi:hypothetical protein